MVNVQSKFRIGDTVTLKTDKETIIGLRNRHGEGNEVGELIDGLLYKEKIIDDIDIDGDIYIDSYYYNENDLVLVKSSKSKQSTNMIHISAYNDVYKFTFDQSKDYAELACGERLQIDDLIELGKFAEKFKKTLTLKKKVVKKVARKKK